MVIVDWVGMNVDIPVKILVVKIQKLVLEFVCLVVMENPVVVMDVVVFVEFVVMDWIVSIVSVFVYLIVSRRIVEMMGVEVFVVFVLLGLIVNLVNVFSYNWGVVM